MAFTDEVTLHLRAGDGGNGIVSWLHEKGREFMGPAGGDGGKGGDVYVKAVRDISRLSAYRYGNFFAAGHGGHGEGKSRHGKDGADLAIEVPIGSVIRNEKSGRSYELLSEGERVRVLHGGRGGFGNEHYKSSRNVRPRESTPGRAGEEADFFVELRLFADAGFIGFPNAGKSSLLNELTRARAKVGSYAFTTLEPNLGDFEGFILADIPGLIEGAHEGKGLGVKFLKHITRTKLLMHCISLESDDILAAYQTVKNELQAFSPELGEKPEVIVLTKTDAVSDAAVAKAVRVAKKKSKHVFTVSVIDDGRLTAFKKDLLALLRTIPD